MVSAGASIAKGARFGQIIGGTGRFPAKVLGEIVGRKIKLEKKTVEIRKKNIKKKKRKSEIRTRLERRHAIDLLDPALQEMR